MPELTRPRSRITLSGERDWDRDLPSEHEQPPYDARPLRRLNLNLLYALDAILRGRTLTEAGRIVSLSQPAMSLALRKLREHFDDKLIVYSTSGRRLTALAEALQPRVARLLREADDTFGLTLEFDTATAHRTISIAAPEAIELLYLSQVAPAILREGPGLEIRLVPFDYRAPISMFEQGLDIAVVPESMLDPRLDCLRLFNHRLSCLVWDGHPTIGLTMTPAQYLSARHAAMFEQMEMSAALGGATSPMLSERRIVVRTGLYSALPNLIVGTDLIMTTNSWLAQYLAFHFELRSVPTPFSSTPIAIFAQWEPHRRSEPVIGWLIRQLEDAVRRIGHVEHYHQT